MNKDSGELPRILEMTFGLIIILK